MSTNIEIEAKALVKENDYKKFVKEFAKVSKKPYEQINYYVDDVDNNISNFGISLRIRKKVNDFELTLKTPLSEGLLEKNQNITINEFKALKENKAFPDGDIKRFLIMLGFDIDKLKIMASLKTTRIDIEYKDGLLSLDKNEYSKKVDYEIEYEYNSKNGAISILKNLFKKLKVDYKENHDSKVVRAFNAIR